MTRPLSLHHLSMLRASPVELVRAARAGRFDHCGIRIVPPDPADQLTDIVHDHAARRDVVSALDAEGIQLLDVEALWMREDTSVATLEPALVAAAELGATYFLTVGHDRDRGRLAHRLTEFSALAAQHEMTVALEFITYTAIKDLREARDIVNAIDADNLVLLVDSLQFFRAGAPFDQLDDVPAELLPYVQLADAPSRAPVGVDALRAEARTARLAPGEGELDLRRFIDVLPPNIPLAIEAPTLELANAPLNLVARRLHDATRRLLASPTPPGGTP